MFLYIGYERANVNRIVPRPDRDLAHAAMVNTGPNSKRALCGAKLYFVSPVTLFSIKTSVLPGGTRKCGPCLDKARLLGVE